MVESPELVMFEMSHWLCGFPGRAFSTTMGLLPAVTDCTTKKGMETSTQPQHNARAAPELRTRFVSERNRFRTEALLWANIEILRNMGDKRLMVQGERRWL
jgi:hypothetical protein